MTAEVFAADTPPPHMPLAFIDLDRSEGTAARLAPPPFPVIGIGSALHPLAAALDAVIEPPIEYDRIVARVQAAPLAAAAAIRLLRMLPALTIDAGLVAESTTYAMLQGSEEHARWREDPCRETQRQHTPGAVSLHRAGDRLTIMLDRAEAGNAIDRPMRDALHEAFALAALDETIRRVDLLARGRVFCLGADLAEFGTTTDPARAHAIRARTLPAGEAARCADKLTAHIDGACIGAGLELAAFARHVSASRRAWFQLPELTMGIIPGAGGCVSLTRRIGRQRTALLILSGQRLSVRQALAWGLVDTLVDEPA